jgi:hypothetical protein
MVAGTALNGVDYQTVSDTVTIPANAASATVTIQPIDDGVLESGEWVGLMLLPSNDYAIGSTFEAGVVIADNDRNTALPIVSVSLTDITAGESGTDTAQFSISRTGATAAPLTVAFTTGGRAGSGVDYNLNATSPVTLPSGAAWVRVTLTGIQDTLVEGEESATLGIVTAPGFQLASQPGVELVLMDDDAPVPAAAARLEISPLARGRTLLASLATGQSAGLFSLWVAADPSYLPLGGVGVFLLDPATGFQLAAGTLDTSGAGVASLPLPAGNDLLGVEVRFQAVTAQVSPFALHLTNAVARRMD